LGDALEKAGFTVSDLTDLRSYSQLAEIKKLLKRQAQIVPVKHLIDCSADPFIPNGWTVEEHQKGDELEWDSTKTILYLSEAQKNGLIVGNDLRTELKGKGVLNANLLDYLLAHPELIPEEWKGKAVFFWGTIYRDSNSFLFVRYLYWSDGRWDWNGGWLGGRWSAFNPALLLASLPAGKAG